MLKVNIGGREIERALSLCECECYACVPVCRCVGEFVCLCETVFRCEL